jgi:uncharacterized protein
MKLNHSDSGAHAVTGYGPGYLIAGGVRYGHALIVSAGAPPQPWPLDGAAELSAAALAPLVAGEVPEIVLIGTGNRQVFPAPAVLRPLIEAGVGIEVMSTAAACRTYNLLLAEGRRVLAALRCPEPE